MKNLYKTDGIGYTLSQNPFTAGSIFDHPFQQHGNNDFGEDAELIHNMSDPVRVLVIATRNPGKSEELAWLLKDFPIQVKNLNDFGPIPEVEEDGTTFDENAYKKSSFTARALGFPALADDSGLVVEALGGRPGVFSARYGGDGLSDADRCRIVLDEMKGQKNRKAAFVSVVSIAVPGGPALTYEAMCEGEIAQEPKGQNGFGYDSIFYDPSLKKTFAELNQDEKSQVSHRGKALREVKEEFDRVMKWIRLHMPVSQCFSGR